jgi:hypothetical protein
LLLLLLRVVVVVAPKAVEFDLWAAAKRCTASGTHCEDELLTPHSLVFLAIPPCRFRRARAAEAVLETEQSRRSLHALGKPGPGLLADKGALGAAAHEAGAASTAWFHKLEFGYKAAKQYGN